jgi:cobalt/nickel transport system ATP-binding protein
MDDFVYRLKNVSFAYLGRFPALCDVTLDIRQGEKVAVIGANGSGKSTLLHLLDGLIFPGSGEVRAFGAPLREAAFDDDVFSESFRKRVGLVFQNPEVQLFCPTVKEDIVFGPLQLGFEKDLIERRLKELSGFLEIGDLLDRAPHRLSIGEKRKVALASTLILDPDVLLLDEPTAGLDPSTTRHIIELLLKANAAGKTVVTSTHDLHIVQEISDTVYVFSREKRLAASGSAAAILEDERLLKEHNLVHAHPHLHKGVVHVHPHRHVDHHH